MRFEISENKSYITVYLKDGDPYMKNLSQLMYHLKKAMEKAGYKNLIKKDLSNEPGNLLSQGCYGLVFRKDSLDLEKGDQIHDGNYVLMYDAAAEFNHKGKAQLLIN